jgi:hypothetical protein
VVFPTSRRRSRSARVKAMLSCVRIKVQCVDIMDRSNQDGAEACEVGPLKGWETSY